MDETGEIMKEERMTLNGVDPKQLYEDVKQHLVAEEFKVILDEARDGFYDVKAHRSSVLKAVMGAIREAEVMISGTSGSCDVTLRTGAWGRDVAIPAVEGFVVLGVIGGAIGAGAGYYMAHEFEKKFWNWIKEDAHRISMGSANVGSIFTPPMLPHDQNAYSNFQGQPAGQSPGFCAKCGSKIVAGAAFCQGCGTSLA